MQYSRSMPWIDPIQDYAQPPRLAVMPAAIDEWPGETETGPDGGLIERYVITETLLDATTTDGLEIVDCDLSGVRFVTDRRHSLEIRGSTLRDCDLSGARIRSMRSMRVIGSRISGADLSGASLSDVLFEECLFQYSNLRAGKLSRVALTECKLEEVDFTGAKLTDVTVQGSDLRLVDMIGAACERVDLRGAWSLSITSGNGLSGCLISDAQVQELAYGLALDAGAVIERS